MLLRAVNGNWTMKDQVNSTNTTPPSKGRCIKESTPSQLEFFVGTVPCHAFNKLFQLCTGHGVLGKYFQMRYISE